MCKSGSDERKACVQMKYTSSKVFVFTSVKLLLFVSTSAILIVFFFSFSQRHLLSRSCLVFFSLRFCYHLHQYFLNRLLIDIIVFVKLLMMCYKELFLLPWNPLLIWKIFLHFRPTSVSLSLSVWLKCSNLSSHKLLTSLTRLVWLFTSHKAEHFY